MAKHRAQQKGRHRATHTGIAYGLVILAMIGFTVGWVFVAPIGLVIMGASGGALAVGLR